MEQDVNCWSGKCRWEGRKEEREGQGSVPGQKVQGPHPGTMLGIVTTTMVKEWI